jgi:hypothetical protein
MKLNSTLAAAVLVASGVVAAQAFAQGAPAKAAEAQRLKNLKAQRDAQIAAAKAQQNTIQRPVPTPTPTVAPTPAPVATPAPVTTTRPTATTTATPTATPTTTTTAPKGVGGAPSVASAAPSASVSALPKPPPVLGLDLEELKKTRPDRRKAEFEQLQARWGELLRDTRASAELKQHAQRTAYLQRIRALASKANDAKTVTAVDILITKEDTRNADAMNALRSGALPAPTPAPAAAAPAGGTK